MSFETPAPQTDLVALLGSRLCHDLISPLGAIGNGVELLAMSGTGMSPELQLIAESVNAANAKLKFFRVAFGKAGADQRLGRPEIVALLDEMSRTGRLRLVWEAEGDHARAQVKLAFLAVLCLETALPFGGTVQISTDGTGGWRVAGEAQRTKPDPALWSVLEGAAHEVPPAQVQFPLLAEAAAALGRKPRWQVNETQAIIEI